MKTLTLTLLTLLMLSIGLKAQNISIKKVFVADEVYINTVSEKNKLITIQDLADYWQEYKKIWYNDTIEVCRYYSKETSPGSNVFWAEWECRWVHKTKEPKLPNFMDWITKKLEE